MNRSELYRGYHIIRHVYSGGYVIKELLDGHVLCSQPSLQFAKNWIDQRHLEIDRMTNTRGQSHV